MGPMILTHEQKKIKNTVLLSNEHKFKLDFEMYPGCFKKCKWEL